MDSNEKKILMDVCGDVVKESIKNMTLFSPEMTFAFDDKDFTLHTLKALSVLDVTEEMKEEMVINTEKSKKRADGTRGSRFDVFIKFPSHSIDIEIQRARRGDEIARSIFYMGKMSTDIDEGIDVLPKRSLISLWICDFNPMPGISKKELPYYVFIPSFTNTEGIRGTDERITIDDVRYVFINGRYDWNEAEKEKGLTEREKAIRDYLIDMRQSKAENIIDTRTRRAIIRCKEGDSEMYDKIEEAMLERWGDLIRKDSIRYAKEHMDEYAKEHMDEYVKEHMDEYAKEHMDEYAKEHMDEYIEKGIEIGESKGIELATENMAKAMLSNGLDINLIAKITNLPIDDIKKIQNK